MIGNFFNEMVSQLDEQNRKDITIYLKDKINEKALNDILIKVGLTSIEIKNSEKSEIYYKFSLNDNSELSKYKDFLIGSNIKLDAEKSCIYIYYYGEEVISGMKEILFKEKILDEVYDKSEEYENNLEKYEVNTDNIIKKIEKGKLKDMHSSMMKMMGINSPIPEKEKEIEIKPYNLFIIKHFIKFVMDKYKQENISSEDNSSNENIENTEEAKNISNNPFINDGE